MKNYGVKNYQYEELKVAALKFGATEDDLNRLGEWFEHFGDRYWNGECYDVGDGKSLYRIIEWDPEDEQGEVIGYSFDGEEVRVKEAE